jgi:hypothetical protein
VYIVYTMDSDGVLVIPGPLDINNCKPLLNVLKKPPEFLDPNGALTLGGYGALAIPSSFHNPDIRFIRKKVYKLVKPQLKSLFPNHSHLELLFDRVSVRRIGTSTSAESWHRDICPNSLEDDIILGGWINLDPDGSPNQLFSCSPGTHKDELDNKTGFSTTKIVPTVKKIYEIPPGHIILFYQNILHEVKAQKSKFESHRLYLGWRLTNSEKPLFDDHSNIIDTQGVPKIPSGQIPPMYAKLHMVNHRHMVDEITNRIRPEYINPTTKKVFRELPTIEQPYIKYSNKDKLIMTPRPF